jgi:hypothetical protein
MVPYSQSLEVQTQTLNPKGSVEIIIAKVNHVAVEGPITQTKWSHMPITFSS